MFGPGKILQLQADVPKVLTTKTYDSDWFMVRGMKWRISLDVDKSNLNARLFANRSDELYLSFNAESKLINQDTGLF